MVIPDKRRIASELIARYVSLEIDNDHLSDDFPRDKRDPALHAIWCNLWFHYSDTNHKAEGKHQLSAEVRDLFDRCAAFLQTDLEYEWPAFKWINIGYGLRRLLGFGKRLDQKFDEFKSHGDFEVWPFIRREDWAKFFNRT